ncbi:MAG: GNAT family N-acetyltransferase [Burkholderiaceae bacterium]
MSLPTTLHVETERLLVRPVAESDLDDLQQVNGDDAVTRFLPYASWRSADDATAWLARMRGIEQNGSGLQLVVAERATGSNGGGRAIGTCLLFRYDAGSARVELGYALAHARWGRGVMREALGALIRHLFDAAGLRRLEAEVHPLNAASCHLLEGLGFVAEGLLRERWVGKTGAYDTRLYGLLARDHAAPSA